MVASSVIAKAVPYRVSSIAVSRSGIRLYAAVALIKCSICLSSMTGGFAIATLCHSALLELQRGLALTSYEMVLQAAPLVDIKESWTTPRADPEAKKPRPNGRGMKPMLSHKGTRSGRQAGDRLCVSSGASGGACAGEAVRPGRQHWAPQSHSP